MKIVVKMGVAAMLTLLPGVGAAAAGAVVQKSTVSSDVHVVAIPTTPQSKPFHTLVDQPAKYQYVEEEFFVSGMARAYEWDGDGHGFDIQAISEPGPYTTRILVLRPKDPKNFSGNIDVELLNSSRGYDNAAMLATSADLIMERGDVYVGVTSKALAVNALKSYDPKRYADLAWSNPVPEENRCPSPTIFPYFMKGGAPENLLGSTSASEDGLIYEIYAQIGALLKSDKRNAILPGFAQPKLFSAGTSQSGMLQRTYVNAFHPIMRLPDGGPIYDGYLIEVAPGVMRINQCSDDIYPGEPRNLLRSIDVPVVHLLSEAEVMSPGVRTRQPNAIAQHSGFAMYEVTGGSHLSGLLRATKASDFPVPTARGDFTFPRGYFSRVALIHLQRWANAGLAPPIAQPLEYRDRKIVRDENGNAIGGVRSVWVDVPVASYEGSTGAGLGAVTGRRVPFTAEKIKKLYSTRDDYVAKAKADVDKLVSDGWLLKEDVDSVMETVKAIPASYWN